MYLNVPSYFPSCTYQDPGIRVHQDIWKHIKTENIYIYIICIYIKIYPDPLSLSTILPKSSSWQSIPAAVWPRPRAAARVCQRAAMPRSAGDDRPRRPRGTRPARRWDLGCAWRRPTGRLGMPGRILPGLGKWGIYPPVNIQKAIENGHL